MFVYYFVHVNRPFVEAEPELVAQLNNFGSLADAAYREGEDLRDKIGLSRDNPVVAKTIQLVAGLPCEGASKRPFPLPGRRPGHPACSPSSMRISSLPRSVRSCARSPCAAPITTAGTVGTGPRPGGFAPGS